MGCISVSPNRQRGRVKGPEEAGNQVVNIGVCHAGVTGEESSWVQEIGGWWDVDQRGRQAPERCEGRYPRQLPLSRQMGVS